MNFMPYSTVRTLLRGPLPSPLPLVHCMCTDPILCVAMNLPQVSLPCALTLSLLHVVCGCDLSSGGSYPLLSRVAARLQVALLHHRGAVLP